MSEPNIDQAPQQSIEYRIAAQFEDQPEEQTEAQAPEEEQEEAAPESDDVEVEWADQKYRVPKALEEAVSKARDYTQKTQTLAEQRRLLDQTQQAMKLAQVEQEFQKETAGDFQSLQMFENYLSQLQQVDIRNLSTDEKLDHLYQVQHAERQVNGFKQTLESKKGEYQKKLASEIDKAKSQAREVLQKQGVKPDSLGQVREYAKELGFTDTALDAIEMDARSTLVLHKAMQFDALQANKSAAVKSLPVAKPGSSKPMSDAVKDKLALHKAFKGAKSKAERDAIMQKRVEALF
jgi:hypothetical protein